MVGEECLPDMLEPADASRGFPSAPMFRALGRIHSRPSPIIGHSHHCHLQVDLTAYTCTFSSQSMLSMLCREWICCEVIAWNRYQVVSGFVYQTFLLLIFTVTITSTKIYKSCSRGTFLVHFLSILFSHCLLNLPHH